MTTKTRAQLVAEAAECLQIVGAGQSLDDEDADLIDGKVDTLIEQLSVDEVVEIDNVEEIPSEYFDALGQLLANSCATKFGLPYDPGKKATFEAQLVRLTASRPTRERLETEYY